MKFGPESRHSLEHNSLICLRNLNIIKQFLSFGLTARAKKLCYAKRQTNQKDLSDILLHFLFTTIHHLDVERCLFLWPNPV